MLYRICNLLALGMVTTAYGSGIIGGLDNGALDPYAAIVSNEGVATAISGAAVPVGSGAILSVAVNTSGAGIIGGRDNGDVDPYVALVSPTGVTTALTGGALPVGSGEILAVAINESGAGIIGGQDSSATPVYAALVSSAGVTTALTGAPIPTGSGNIRSVGINDSGAAIIGGGENTSTPYIALVSSAGVRSALSGPAATTGAGIIFDVAINNSGAGIVGGQDNGFATPYAVLVSNTGVRTALTGAPAPVGDGSIRAVAINDSGAAIIGGQDNGSSTPYVALVSSAGVRSALSGSALPAGNGIIRSVAINSSGAAIIGGQEGFSTAAYAALVSSAGVTTSLSAGGVPLLGNINSVAISDTGVGLIGGSDTSTGEAFVALVSPTGVVTPLTGSALPIGVSFIQDVDISNAIDIMDAFVPQSFGGGSSFANSLFALTSQVSQSHYGYQHKAPYNKASNSPDFSQEVGLLADATDSIRWNTPCTEDAKYSLWAIGFGDYVRQKKSGSFPKMKNWIGGAMIGFDYRGFENGVIGLGAAYAYNSITLSGNGGNAKTHQEFLTVYGSWNRKYFFINLALWGGLYQSRNTRRTMNMTAKANVDGWLLSPHLEISTPFYGKEPWFVIEPFVMFDWANNWQDGFKESGASGFNIVVGNQYSSLLRSEAGLRFYQSLGYTWGSVILLQKGSWVNKKPFHANSTTASFVGSASSFGIEVFSNKTQNLGAIEFSAQFIPCKKKYPYGALNYQGEFGSTFQSHLISAEIGKNF